MAVQLQPRPRIAQGQAVFPVTERPSIAVLAKAQALILAGWLAYIEPDQYNAYRFPSQRTPDARYSVVYSADGHRVTCSCKATVVCTHIATVSISLGICALWDAAEPIPLPAGQPQRYAS